MGSGADHKDLASEDDYIHASLFLYVHDANNLRYLFH